MAVTNWHLTEPPLYEEWRGRKKRGGGQREEREGRELERKEKEEEGDGEGREGKGTRSYFPAFTEWEFQAGWW